ncbi:sorting nexin-19 [Elysia marginata]|uniref:Sorting nexin-19 n=1 Tax=Elysia marginata TaxID=1093978 RepID=A0AAV4IGU4_9GAST|nr:sorting nexin-19 [Elysia marginata]
MAESDEGFKKLVLDLLTWERYSTLQKLAILFIVSCVISWWSSLWTLAFILIISFCAGFKLSEQALHHEKASLVAEQVLDKLESIYLQLRSYFYKVKTLYHQMLVGNQPGKDFYSTELKDVGNEITPNIENQPYNSTSTSIRPTLPNDVGQELNSIQLLILRDFIRSWYADYSYDPQFLKDTKLLLQQTFNNLVSRVAQQDPNTAITQVVKIFMIHLANYQKAENSFQSHKIHPNTKVVTGSALKRHSSVDEAFKSLSTFHCALDSEHLEQEYLKGVMSLFVVCTCNSQVIKGVCARTLLVDILAQNILLPLIQMISEPDWLANIIIRITSYEEEKTESSDVFTLDGAIASSYCEEVQNVTLIEERNIDLSRDEEQNDVKFSQDKTGSEAQGSTSTLTSSEMIPKHNKSCQNTLCAIGQDEQGNSETEKTENSKERVSPSVNLNICQTSLELQSERSDQGTSNFTDEQFAHVETTEEESDNKGQISKCAQNHISLKVSQCDEVKDQQSSPLSCQLHADIGKRALDYDYNADDYDIEDIDVDPQKIISFSSNSSSSKDVTLISAPSDSEANAEHPSQSLSKLSSLKHFLVDSLKSGNKQQQPQVAKKPKTLSILSGITSNLNPLSSKNPKSATDVEKTNSSTTPKLLVDGVPLSRETISANNLSEIASGAGTDKVEDLQLTPAISDCDASPAAGFFSNINSLFSFSASTHSNSECVLDPSPLSPLLTPSPTAQDAPPSANQDSHSFESNNAWHDMVKSYIFDDRRIFQDVSIPETVLNTEYRSSTQYSLYIIHYEALYFSEEGKSIIRSGTVRRRYREFTNLQSRLESQVSYKQFMKKIRGPKRWPSLPFKSIDRETVEARRLFLEKYLKDLIEIEAICNSPDIREFLAYEGDSHIAFVKKSPEINVPRLDKMLMRGVSGVVDRLMSIPNNAQEVISGLRSRETPEDKLGAKPVDQHDVDMFDINCEFAERMEFNSSNLLWESCVGTIDDSRSEAEEDLFNISKVLADQKTTDKMEMVYRQEVEKILASLPSSKNDESHTPENSDKTPDSSDVLSGQCEEDAVYDETLGSAVIDLLVQGLQGTDHWLSHDRVVQSLQAVLGKALNRYLSTSISNLVSQDQLAFYLLTLRETIWPQGQLWTDKSTPTTSTAASSQDNKVACDGHVVTQVEEKEGHVSSEVKAKACRAIGSMFPDSVKLAIGKQEFEDLINVFLDSLQSEQLNRNLLYEMLDQLLEDLFPEVATFDLIHNLLFSSLSPNLTMPRLVKEAEKL